MKKSRVIVRAVLLTVSLALPFGHLLAKEKIGTLPPIKNGIVVYPDNVANPRVPTVAPEIKGACGACMEVEETFSYALAPLVSFENGGSASFFLRDNPRRTAKTPLALEDGKIALAVTISPASEGRKIGLARSSDKQVVAHANGNPSTGAKWIPLTLRWTDTEATLEIDGKTTASLKLSAPFNPKRVSLNVYHVDELALSGDGTFKLDWESGYAARCEPRNALDTVVARLHGFDAMVVSQEPLKRDCPMIQVCNASLTQRKTTLGFSLTSEVRNVSEEWSQEVNVLPCSSIEVAIKFPSALETDIYHLSTRAEGADLPERDVMRNFMFVTRRNEPAGPPKFGFHTFGVTVPGSWPDALPVQWRHMYANWGYIVGPMWINDWDGKPGLNPDTPPEEWWWEPRVDWAIKEGRKMCVCALSVPYFPWMREKELDAPYMSDQYPWGRAGGRPDFKRYRQFIHAMAERYKGKVDRYELDNEPNTVSFSGKPAAEYADVVKAAGGELHATDPHAKVFGICGTSQFVDYMRGVFACGAVTSLDGVSWHTYTTPMLPAESGLPQMLKRAKETILAAGRELPVMNSETGVYCAPRETADQPIRPERLAELIKQGVRPLHVPTGWPSYALDEWTAAKSMVQNITINFAAGVSPFIFFGWDPVVEKKKSWWGAPDDFDCFSIFARVKDGTMTPSLYTLACAVAMTQMEGVLTEKATPVDQDGILGAVFDKANGSQLAVLWSSSGLRTAMLRTSCPELETVSLFGVQKLLSTKGVSDSFLHRIELGDQPIYFHLKKKGLTIAPSPVISFERAPGGMGEQKIKFTLVNRYGVEWEGPVKFSDGEGLTFVPAKVNFSLDPGKRTNIQTVCTLPLGMARGVHLAEVATKLPDGAPFVFPMEIDVRPGFTIPRLSSEFSLKEIREWKPLGEELVLDKLDQVAIGRPPKLTSLQEERYWKGPDELSARVATGFTDKGFFTRVTVHDKNEGALKQWPGVEGSCIEVFIDFRSPDKGLGNAPYDEGVVQIVVKPALTKSDKIELWFPNRPSPLKGVEVVGGVINNSSYWVGMCVPWSAIDGASKLPEAIGFDVAVNGPPAGVIGRKSQIILFGGANNCKDASGFGAGRLK